MQRKLEQPVKFEIKKGGYMVKKKIQSIIFHLDNRFAINCLSDEKAGQLFKAIMQYGYDGSIPSFSEDAMQGLFAMYQVQIDHNKEVYAETCERNRKNAESRYKRNREIRDTDEKHVQIMEKSPPRIHSDATACNSVLLNTDACLYNNKCNDNNKNNDGSTVPIIPREIEYNKDHSFERIWEIYGKPIGNVTQLKEIWENLTSTDKEDIMAYVPQYVKLRKVKYRKNFLNFLNQRTWITEPIKETDYETNINNYTSDANRGDNAKAEAMEVMQELIANNQQPQFCDDPKNA